jgi:hypothetical protein
VSADRLDAVVFYERRCASGCGSAAWFSFQRPAIERPWNPKRRAYLWIQ